MANVATAKPRTRRTFPKPEGIEAGKVYPVSALGLGAWALRSARAAGLELRYTLGRCYVRGEDWLAFIARQSSVPPQPGRRKAQQASD